ncbi:SAP-like protein BP-73 [Cucumis melo var. makuwa]|uniref:SAP-like protein BP-73 n=2 Tax=Cucumis melo TaxID=3656 RepID=A0A5A7UMB7_CUCMM|nr:SAP-like protein BP-73 [Cucumis melo var. makuwa]
MDSEMSTWEHDLQKLNGPSGKSDGSSSFPASYSNPLSQFNLFEKKTHVRFESLLNLADIADVYPSKNIQLSVSNNRPDGNARNRPPRRNSLPGKTRKSESSSRKKEAPKNEENIKKSKPNDQEEIIALFRKIQASIAKESASSIDEESHKDEHGATSILETLREPRKQLKGKTSKKAGAKVFRSKGTSEEKEMHDPSPPPAADFKLVRPPSKFVKRSPIPPKVDASQAIAESRELKFPSIENMKLAELKALAKSRGIKGYSKLKKNELMEILRS